MRAKEINDQYIDLIKNRDFYKDYLETVKRVSESNAKYKGKPIPFLYHPMFFTNEDIDNFKSIAKTLISISNKVVKEYIDNPQYRKKFGFSKLLEELILVDHGYEMNIPMGRFDIFYNDIDDFKFCELNTDGSSAMNEDNTLSKILLDTEAMTIMKEKYNIDYMECINSWVDKSIPIYEEFSGSNIKPTVAIVDFTESATSAEFIEFKKAYERQGYKTFICDVRELKYVDGKLLYDGHQIDLIYRRIVTKELIDRSHEVEDFIRAYKEKAMCVIGPLKSQIMHNKKIFKILHEDETLSFLNRDEQEFVKNHIPTTKVFEGNEAIFHEVLKNKDKYIIKPCDLYGSRGVYVGLDYNDKEWEKILKECFDKDYLYQEYFYPFERDFIEYNNDQLKINSFKCITGLFIYGEEFSGLYTRIGKNRIISGLHGYNTLPNLIVTKK